MQKLSLSEKFGIGAILLAAVPYFLSIIVSVAIYREAGVFINEQQSVTIAGKRLIDDIKTGALYLGLLARDADFYLSQRNSVTAAEIGRLRQQTIEKTMNAIAQYKREFALSARPNKPPIKTSDWQKLVEEELQALQKLEVTIQVYLQQVSLQEEKKGERVPLAGKADAVISQSEDLSAFLDQLAVFSAEAYKERFRLFSMGLFGFWILTVGGSGLLAFLLTKKVAKPIEQLSEIAIDIAGGKTRAVPYRKEKDEITDLYNAVRSMDDSLIQNIRELDKTSRTKSEFISIASHQLRTPLSAIKWLIELLKENSNPTEEQKSKLNDIYESNERLITLVNDLLNVSRLESGKMQASLVSTDLVNLVNFSIKEVIPDAEAKAQKINLVVDPEVKEVKLDPMFFNEAFINIIQNAIAYAPNKSIIDVKINRNGNNYVVAVHNEGPAILEMEHEKLFTKFYRGTVAQRLRPTGSGLGLFIAKAAIEAQGGKIWFESPTDPNSSGVTFYISIPAPIN